MSMKYVMVMYGFFFLQLLSGAKAEVAPWRVSFLPNFGHVCLGNHFYPQSSRWLISEVVQY